METDPPVDADVLNFDCCKDEDEPSGFLVSEEDDDNEDVFDSQPGLHSQRPRLSPSDGSGAPTTPPSWICWMYANAQLPGLDVPWPVSVTETTQSCYDGMTFLLARHSVKQSSSLPRAV